LKPANHFDFVHRFDPEAPAIHGHGTAATVTKKWKGKPTLLGAVTVNSLTSQDKYPAEHDMDTWELLCAD
jgi:hypothetical protein